MDCSSPLYELQKAAQRYEQNSQYESELEKTVAHIVAKTLNQIVSEAALQMQLKVPLPPSGIIKVCTEVLV